ncbi:MAG: L-threonine 3-dehydrogenase [bacterium]|nr:L-threonine 3-dehydrogenase [bacterium]
MQAIAKLRSGPGGDLIETPRPEPAPRELLVRVKAASICGTDVHIYDWDPWAAGRVKPPLVLGHEFGGIVEAVGEQVTSFRPGDLVSAETHIVCDRCYQCRVGQAHICQDVSILGVDRDGAFAEFVTIPEQNAWLNPPDMSPEVAAIQEPMGNAVHTVLAGAVAGLRVAVLGCGPIGLLSVAVARACGASAVYAVEPSAYRRGLAARLGATLTLDPRDTNPADRVRELTGGEGADVVLEMSGNPGAVVHGLRMARNGGRVSLLGLPPRPLEIDLSNDVVMRGLTLQGIAGRRMYATWYQTRELLASGQVDPAPLITHRFDLASFGKAFELVKRGECGKVVLLP